MKETLPRNVIVTGGSRGIGFAVAKAFTEDGARVLIVARQEAELEAAKRALGEGALARTCDVSDQASVASLQSVIEGEFGGRVDVLVNAAGVYGPIGLLEDCDPSFWKKTFEVNVFGTAQMCRLVLPYMKRKGSGRIIHFSGGGEGAFSRFTAYASSKGAILRFTESLAAEVRGDGITVNAIAPGGVNTALTDEALAAGPERAGEAFYEKMKAQKESGGVPPEQAARLIVFLASDAAREITGKVLSAAHDDLTMLARHAGDIATSDVYAVRRIKPNDRGYEW